MKDSDITQNNDSYDFSNQNLVEFPLVPQASSIIRLNLSNNNIKSFPKIEEYKFLRYLDISSNRISDLSILNSLTSLHVLDCSFNQLSSLSFTANLLNLEILNASHNRIAEITSNLPQNLLSIDLSYNHISSFEFLQEKCPTGIEKLFLSNNKVDSIMDLKYISVFRNLRILNVGFLDKFLHLRILSFVKYILPYLEVFDDTDCSHLDTSNEWDYNELINILLNGDEEEFRGYLMDNSELRWDEPVFFDFVQNVPPTPLREVNERLRNVELLTEEQENRKMRIDSDRFDEDIAEIRREINELKQQTLQISQLLFVHDKALQQIWESH